MIVFIDGENFRQNLASVLAEKQAITDKDLFFEYDIPGLLKDVLGRNDLEIRYYASAIKTPRGYTPTKAILKQITKINERMRKWVAMLKRQEITYIKAGNLKVKEGKKCPRCRAKSEQLQEKGVDVRIALDLFEASLGKKTTQLAVVSSDTDLCPAYHKAKSHRTKLFYICFASRVNRAVAAICDETVTITAAKAQQYLRPVNKTDKTSKSAKQKPKHTRKIAKTTKK